MVAATMAAGLVLALFPSEAFAFTWLTKQCQGFAQCDAKGLGNDGYENEYNSPHWGAYSGHNCTNYAAYRLSRRGIPNLNFPGGQGSAYNWSNIAGQRGYPTDGSPRVGDIAWFAAGAGGEIGGSGHVAYVESIDGNRVTVSEDNCLASSGTHCTGGDFDWRQYYISDVSGFIHFGGQPPADAAVPSNLLRNSSFEEGSTAGWGPGAGTPMNYTAYRASSSVSAREGSWFAAANVPVAGRSFAQEVGRSVKAGESYTGSIWLRSSTSGQFTGTLCLWGLGGSQESVSTSFSVGPEWTLVSSSLNAKSDHGGLKLEVYMDTIGPDLYFDGASLGAGNAQWNRVSVSSTVPTISQSRPKVATTLSIVPGAWGPAPVSLSYRWFRVTSAGVESAINGATNASYSVQVADVGYRLRVKVTGSKPGYKPVTKASAATDVVPELALSATPVPTVSGTVRVGSMLTANSGAWLPAPVSLAYQWLRNGVAVGGATKTTLVLGSADLGAVMSVRATGSKAGYVSVARTSVVTSKVLPAVVLTAPVPSVSGSVRVGGTLTVKPGVWGPAPVSLAYQWLRNGVAVVGASKVTYLVDAADLGKVIVVRVTGSRSGFASVVRTSASTGRVVAGVLSAPVPRISGKAKVGRTLAVKPGTWKPVGVVLGVQWYRNGKQIVGAIGSSYKLVKADRGKRVTVKVTGSKPGYTTVTKTSKKTAKVKK